MKITFVNHASFLLETKAASIWCDPWTMGKVVNNCCALYSPSAHVPIERVDHIWLSHEHPDHFNFPTLKSIPEADRRRITILYQRHSSPRVVEALKKLGFEKIKELPLYRWLTLKPGFDILCGSVGTMDSFLTVYRVQNSDRSESRKFVLLPAKYLTSGGNRIFYKNTFYLGS